MQNVLTDIAGLLVLVKVFTLMIRVFHEKRFISKMNQANKNEDFREVFTYENIKRLIDENKEMKEEIKEMREFMYSRR